MARKKLSEIANCTVCQKPVTHFASVGCRNCGGRICHECNTDVLGIDVITFTIRYCARPECWQANQERIAALHKRMVPA